MSGSGTATDRPAASSYSPGRLDELPPQVGLPTDFSRPPSRSFRRGRVSCVFDASLAARVAAACDRERVSLVDVALAACALVLSRRSGHTDLIIGSPAVARSADADGSFVHLLPLRLDLHGDPTAAELIRRVDSVVREAAEHRDRRWDPSDASSTGVAPIWFAFLADGVDRSSGVGALAASARDEIGDHLARCDLVVELRRTDTALTLVGDYDADLFEAPTVDRLLAHVRVALVGLLDHPDVRSSALSLLSDEERALTTVAWNATDVDVESDACVHGLFERQVDRTPDRAAVSFRDESLSYRDLDRRANRLAHRLIARGVGPEVLVAICLERTSDLLVAMLGVLKAGGAYVPLDPRYPAARLEHMLRDSNAAVLLTRSGVRLDTAHATAITMDIADEAHAAERDDRPPKRAAPEHVAYVIYTSGSTGTPKGVVVEHRNVINFFAGMDRRIDDAPGVWLAVTSLSFDISVLELLWPLTRGDHVVLHPGAGVDGDPAARAPRATARGASAPPMQMGLFYFASDDGDAEHAGRARYHLLMEGARFADEHGFSAVWTPERHFHSFGGLYPSPAVTSAALASITRRVQIRAGSVVLPLHDPVRVAEEWSVIDNLSDGRVAISFASGWQPEDFVFAPQHYAQRHDVMFDGIDTIRRLWRGESVDRPGGHGRDVVVRLRPRPVQPELPCWVTAGGTPSTFRRAGEIGANVLTHLLGQSLDELAERIAIYREAWRSGAHGSDRGADRGDGHVTLMLHTFVGDDEAQVRSEVAGPLTRYLRGSVSLFTPFAAAAGLDVDHLSEADLDTLAQHAFDRYYTTSGLFGTPASCLALIDRLQAIGVDEIACLIDFGIPEDTVLRSLSRLDELRELASARATSAPRAPDDSIAALIRRHGVTHLQCTPSLASMLVADAESADALRTLRALMVGGEALPSSLASALASLVSDGRVLNMYGPTETTIWSTTHAVTGRPALPGTVPIGRPIANTRVYIVDERLRPVPIGVVGELLIGGRGVARGYLGRPELTAERFVDDPVAGPGAGRCYRTGDLARYRADGTIEYVGRRDDQVKLRGHRIELGEIEATLRRHPSVGAAVVTVREDVAGDRRLVAYVVPAPGAAVRAADLRAHAASSLPAPWVPSTWVVLSALPLTPNGKIDRRALPAPSADVVNADDSFEAPRDDLERRIEETWRAALRLDRVDVRDNFFALGGHSLLVIHVLNQLSARLGRVLSMDDMFRHPTIREFATFLARQDGVMATEPSAPPASPALARPIKPQPRIPTPR